MPPLTNTRPSQCSALVNRAIGEVLRKSQSLTNFAAGDQSFDYGDSEVDSLSMDFEKGLNLHEESESGCVTNDTSFTKYDYLNERGSSDEGEGASAEWDEECIPFEEELTDLDTEDDDDFPMSEQDMEDSASIDNCSASKHLEPLKTCVQQELTPHHHHHHHHQHQRFNEAFLQVKGAGLVVLEREIMTPGSTVIVDEQRRCHDGATASGKVGQCGVDAARKRLDLVAEVERRRLRDFGPLMAQSDDHELEPGIMSSVKQECIYEANIVQGEGIKSVTKVSTDEVSLDQKSKSGSATVKTCGETSSAGDGSLQLGISTPQSSDQPSPALTPSLFPGCRPPTIHFPMPNENCE